MKYHHLRLHQLQLTSLHHEVCLLKVPLILLHLLLQYHRHAFPERFLLLQHHHQVTHLKVRCCLHLAQSYRLRLRHLNTHLEVLCYLHRFQRCRLLHSALRHHQVIRQVMPYCHLRYLNQYCLLRHQIRPIIHLIKPCYHLQYLA